jgi:hypothetical protein
VKLVHLPDTEGIPRLQKPAQYSWHLSATDLAIDVAWDLIDSVMRYYGGHRLESMPATLSKAFKALCDARGGRNLAVLSQALQNAVAEVGHAVTPLDDCPVLAAYSESVRLLKYSLKVEVK